MKVEEAEEYGNKSKNSMYENIYTGLFNFGNIRTVYRNKNREHIVFNNYDGFDIDFLNSGVIF